MFHIMYQLPCLLSVLSNLIVIQYHAPFATAASIESENKEILQRMELDVLSWRNELESVYSKRCETKTLVECGGSNFNDCSSTFPGQVCLKQDELVISECGDGQTCNGKCTSIYIRTQICVAFLTFTLLALWDKTFSTVSIPSALADAPNDNPSDPEIIESACYTRLAEPYMIDKYQLDEQYWSKYNVQPSWTYFGAHNGLFRKIPAIHQEVCGLYDARRRPWFVAASSGPKDVLIVIDTSGSMNDVSIPSQYCIHRFNASPFLQNRYPIPYYNTQQYGRLELAKEAAITVVETLTVADRVAVISFSNVAHVVGGYNTLVRATNYNKAKLIQEIKGLYSNGGTNFQVAFETAFNSLDKTIQAESTSGCNIAVLFLTDGEIAQGSDEVIQLVNDRTEELATKYHRKTTIFTFSLGYQADHEVTKSIACNTGGIWTPVEDLSGDLIDAMSSYYKLYALGLGEGGNEDFVAWVEPYEFHNPKGKMGTTVSVPVYDRSVSPHLFLGVAAIDMYMDALEQVLGEDALSSSMLDRFVMLSTARCPSIQLSECELDALRFLGGGEEATCGVCNKTSYYSGIVPEKCSFNSDLPNDLWDNTDSE